MLITSNSCSNCVKISFQFKLIFTEFADKFPETIKILRKFGKFSAKVPSSGHDESLLRSWQNFPTYYTNDIRARAINCNHYESMRDSAAWFMAIYNPISLVQSYRGIQFFPDAIKYSFITRAVERKIDYPYTLCSDILENLKHGRCVVSENIAGVIFM